MNDNFVPPPPLDPETREELLSAARNMTELKWFLLRYKSKKDPRLLKYRRLAREYDKASKRSRIKDWWWSKGIQIVNLILALIAAITGVIALLR